MQPEIDREGLSSEKITHFFRTMLGGKTRKADAYLDKFLDLDVEILRMRTRKKLRAILLDVDACIAPAYSPIYEINLKKIRELREHGVEVGIYSNCKDSERLAPLIKMGVPHYTGKLAKPSADGFVDACQTFGFSPRETWMVGDDPNTDGGAVGVLEGMVFVKPLMDNTHPLKFTKKLKLSFKNLFRHLGMLRTLYNNPKIIRTADLRNFTSVIEEVGQEETVH